MAPHGRKILGPAAGALLLLAGCDHLESVPVNFRTDPATGRTDGPFDPATGRRVMTQVGADGVLRVVLDPVSKQPILLTDPVAPARERTP